MPKINYSPDDWAFEQWCYYCGEKFTPIDKEQFCCVQCESQNSDYFAWYDTQLIMDLLNEED